MRSFQASTLRPLLVIAVSLATGLALFVASPSARAQGKAEGPAKALQKKAMEEDYLMTEFSKAQEKLEKAIGQCGEDKCSPALRARLKRDLGVVQIGGGLDKDKGLANFVEAIKLDATVALEPDIKTKDLEQAFAEAKKRAGGGGATPVEDGEQPEGDFVHTPAAAQQIRTPIPVYVEYAGEETLTKVLVRYKGFGMTEWKKLDLTTSGGKGWSGLIPCGDVQQGTTQYYIQGFDANNDPIAVAGDRNNPYKVPVTREKPDEPPHLPNASPPTQCADTGDCPPNFPGCKKASTGPDEKFEPVGKDGGEFCEEDSDCKSDKCEDAKCTDYEGKKKGPRFWLGIAGSLDLTFVPSAEDVCKVHPRDADDTNTVPTPLNDSNYYCTTPDGTDFPSRTSREQNDRTLLSNDAAGGSDRVDGGSALGNIRLMLTLDYVVHPNVMIGGRLGLVLGGYGGKEADVDGKRFAVPIHLELRVTYVVGKDALFKKGFAPYVFGGAGIGKFETGVGVQTIEARESADSCFAGANPVANSNLCSRDLDAWHIAGPAFISVGGGGRYAVTPRFALMFGLRANLAFLNAFAPSVGPELGGQFAF